MVGSPGPTVFDNRYLSLGTSASGGSGTVIRCRDQNLDRDVAIKFLQPGIPRRRISDEIAALERIRSKHVVQFYDVIIVTPGNQVGVVQEYLSGNDLRAEPPEQSVARLLRALYQVAHGIADVHAEGIIHRDVKPNNIRRDAEGLLKLFDFDLARDEQRDAQTTGFRGTPGFAAPELYGFGHVVFTQAVDVYGLAATALFCIDRGLPPEFLENPPRAEQWVARQGFHGLPTQLPSDVTVLLNQCLARDPAQRPKMADVLGLIAARLLHDQHRAVLMHNGTSHVCDASRRTVTLNWTGVGRIVVEYNGLRFVVREVEGSVWINNQTIGAGTVISGCCVVTLGDVSLKARRKFITFDVSHPEVVL
jgi:eukaryotic-like serine/threonine-protein kinase